MSRVWRLASRLGASVYDRRLVSRMGRIDAARHTNEITLRLLKEGIV